MEIDILCRGEFKLIDPNTLQRHPDNNNKHSPEQIERLAKIIKENGWTSEITVSLQSNYITKGHARLEAALLLGCKLVPVKYIKYRSKAHEYADLTADNEIARWAELDRQKVVDKVLSLKQEGHDLDTDILGMKDDLFNQMEQDAQQFNDEINQEGVNIDEFDRQFDVKDRKEKEEINPNIETEKEKLLIIIECFDELNRNLLFEEFKNRNIKCRLQND